MRTVLQRATLFLTLLAAICVVPLHAQDDPCDNPEGRLAFTACLEHKLEQADQELERLFQAALKVIEASENGPEEIRLMWKEALRKNQALWYQYRDSECEDVLIPAYWGSNGVGEGIVRCKLEMTEQRIGALQEQYRLDQER